MGPLQIAHTVRVAGTLATRALRRRLAGDLAPPHSHADFVAGYRPWAEALPRSAVAASHLLEIPVRQPPWFDTGIDLAAGEQVTLLAAGRVYLSRLLDIWVGPDFQLWCRIGPSGQVFRGTRDTHTFTADRAGRLYLCSYFPGEWADPGGRLSQPVPNYRQVSGGLSTLILRWAAGADARVQLAALAAQPAAPPLVHAEAERLATSSVTPEGWHDLFSIGPSEVYRLVPGPGGRPAMACHSHGGAAILQKDTPMPLRPGTFLEWSWKVDQLPSDLPEDTLPSHDYLSIAVEFEGGQDLTYYWSSRLPVGRVYRCPLPYWCERETHMVLRSGSEGLGTWHRERRELFADYAQCIGTPPPAVTRVWLIAASIFQRGTGRCEYSDVRLTGSDAELTVI